MEKNTNAQKALDILNELKELDVPEVGDYEQAESYIKTTGNVSNSFLESLKSKLSEVKNKK